MEAAWIETFYQETDAPKRLELLKQNTENKLTQADVFRKKLWVARYGKRKPTKDAFVGSLMELKCLAEGTSLDFGGQRRKQAAKIISTLCLDRLMSETDSFHREAEELRENLLLELKNVFLKFMEVSRDGRGFTSLVFGMGQLSDEGVVKKIAEQISAIAFQAPHALHMDKEFALLQEAALQAFRQEYPNREHFLKK